ncbi:hypothetical protein [Cytobacillus gottheilii]|nr:hypothetical protein [Cytobacillus gottheilii]
MSWRWVWWGQWVRGTGSLTQKEDRRYNWQIFDDFSMKVDIIDEGE